MPGHDDLLFEGRVSRRFIPESETVAPWEPGDFHEGWLRSRFFSNNPLFDGRVSRRFIPESQTRPRQAATNNLMFEGRVSRRFIPELFPFLFPFWLISNCILNLRCVADFWNFLMEHQAYGQPNASRSGHSLKRIQIGCSSLQFQTSDIAVRNSCGWGTFNFELCMFQLSICFPLPRLRCNRFQRAFASHG